MLNSIVQASIITIGDELMIGQVIDTNSAWIAQQLNNEGIWIRKRVSVGDAAQEIRNALDAESTASQIVLITGGLGPTADDITKPLLCEYFNSRLIVNEQVLAHVRHLFEEVFKRPFTELNRKQAEVPEACTMIHNSRGTAPGMLFEKNGVIFISMPGVPHEMQGMMTDHVLPLLRSKFITGFILHKTLLTAGIGESALAEHIASWELTLPPYLKLAYLPNYGMVRLRITGTGNDKIVLERELNKYFASLRILVMQWLVTDEDLSMVQVVAKLLQAQNKTLACAESCTGGYISHLITSEAGSSSYFTGSIISYANEVKEKYLQVTPSTLHSVGAVSEETVKQMVQGVMQALGTDCAIATSGIMGPGGGTAEKPVGTVWIAAAHGQQLKTLKLQLRFDRRRNIEITAIQSLNLLRKLLEPPANNR